MVEDDKSFVWKFSVELNHYETKLFFNIYDPYGNTPNQQLKKIYVENGN